MELGNAEPIAILISSAAVSPIATPYRSRMCSWIAASRSNPPSATERPLTTPPIETTAISERPPPMSTIRLPIGSWMGRPAPIAAASGSSTSVTLRPPPAKRTASSIARFSTSELIDGHRDQHARPGEARGRCERFTTTSSIRWVMSNSVMAPARSGRTATTLPESPPIRSQASSPIASTSPVPPCSATTVGSLKTMPSPCR